MATTTSCLYVPSYSILVFRDGLPRLANALWPHLHKHSPEGCCTHLLGVSTLQMVGQRPVGFALIGSVPKDSRVFLCRRGRARLPAAAHLTVQT